MTPPTLKYCVYDPDRRGNDRWYARKQVSGRWRKQRIRAELPEDGVPSPEFMAAYWAALAVLDGEAATGKPTPREDSFAWLWDQYQRSPIWKAYDPATRADKRSVIGRWIAPVEHLPFRKYRQQDVKASQAKRVDTPAAADKLVKYLRSFLAWAIDAGHMDHNPAVGVSKIAPPSKGAMAWTAADVAAYRNRHPVGTQARLALELMLQVGARISDAAKLGRQHEYDFGGARWLGFTAHKNRNRNPVRIDQPMRAELIAAIAACKVVGDLTYLVTERGVPFTIKGLGNKVRGWCDQAGLKASSAHGLRKASATELAEDGATAHQLMAWFGWTKIETAEIYTRAAEKKRLSQSIYDLSERRRNKSVSLSGRKKRSETNRRKSDE